MKTIIKKGVGKTKIEKQNEKEYVKKCWNCKSIFIYQNEDLFNSYDYGRFVSCPKCASSNSILFKRKFKRK